MLAVGIKELKSKLSQYVRLAEGGEVILVTDRNRVVAELRQAPSKARSVGPLERTLEDLAGSGELSRSSVPKNERITHFEGLGLPEGSAGQLLDDLRQEW